MNYLNVSMYAVVDDYGVDIKWTRDEDIITYLLYCDEDEIYRTANDTHFYDVPSCGRHKYKLYGITRDGVKHYLNSVEVFVSGILKEMKVIGFVPNPFRQESEFVFALPEDRDVEFKIYDISGRRIREEVIKGNRGLNRFNVNGLSGGIYFYYISDGRVEKKGRFEVIR